MSDFAGVTVEYNKTGLYNFWTRFSILFVEIVQSSQRLPKRCLKGLKCIHLTLLRMSKLSPR